MGETSEFNTFVILVSIILLVFIVGILLVLIQYIRRKARYDRERTELGEQHLRELLSTKLEIQQYTMQEIGREIHDSVNQKLTLGSLYTYQLESEPGSVRQKELILKVGALINESLDELRSLSKSLSPNEAEEQSLPDLVEKECKRINSLNTCCATYYFNATNITLSPTLKNYLLRIIQEFLQNSLKHANCINIFLDFNFGETGLSIALKDDGTGFDLENCETSRKGIGLTNMKKRSNLLGIEFTLNSRIWQGTEVKLFIPANKLNI